MSAAPAPRPEPARPVTDADSFAEATGATPAQMANLERYRALLAEWNERLNLVGPSAFAEFWPRHTYDSWQVLGHAPSALTFADLGTGAGLPGVVLAIFLKGLPGAHVHLVDSLAKRCRFLTEVVDQLALPATVHNARAEALTLSVDVVTARACAPLTRLLGYARPSMGRGTTAVFLKGETAEAEVEEARRAWRFNARLSPSLSDPRGRVVVLKGLQPHGR